MSCSTEDPSSVDSYADSIEISEYEPLENIYGSTITVEMKIKDFGVVVIDLFPDEAPITVENFVSKVEEGFYDGLIIHRVVPGYLIQGGDPTGTGSGEEGQETIKGEFAANGILNRIPHQRGVISMARKPTEKDSATSQFFICVDTSDSISDMLDGQYASFGCVTSGMEVIDLITTVSCDVKNRPNKDVVIEYIKVIGSNFEESTVDIESSSDESLSTEIIEI